ncbi:hypothetical protein [Lachnoanaerobaculum saburreum]|uniref:Uncharacterized protein n=1 Tax=Lachnoanaerobaculum saburreum TaxID=467210 RepID=A0A134A025_9FIRM|nr:hypothetical protein [Lachnoanaerobaculum saburreum]KXB61050.1 hypothetical protein HMPREF1866_00187 [Lachnoanaerobaculum saburreum]
MTVKKIKGILLLIFVIVVVYIINQIAFFHDKEFERAVRDTLSSQYMDYTTKRDKPIFGIIWKKDLEKIVILSLNVREYHVKNISDIRYFKNTKAIWIIYRGAYEGDTSIYEEENLLNNIYVAKNFKNLNMISLYHVKVNKDIKVMFPNVDVFIE